MNRSQANILLVLVALIWGSAFVAQARGMDGVGPFTFTGLRFLLGVCVVAPFAWRDWRKLQAREVRPGKPELYGVVGLGALLALGAVFQQIGMLYTTVTNAGFLTALYVPLVPLLSWGLLRLRPHWSTWPTALGCLFGTWLLSGANGLNVGVGDAWVILSSLFWGLHVFLFFWTIAIEAWLSALAILVYMVISPLLSGEIRARQIEVIQEKVAPNLPSGDQG